MRLRGKPHIIRRVQEILWHHHEHEHVFVVETSSPTWLSPYGFAEQLVVVESTPCEEPVDSEG